MTTKRGSKMRRMELCPDCKCVFLHTDKSGLTCQKCYDKKRRVKCAVCGSLTGKHIEGTICGDCWRKAQAKQKEDNKEQVRKNILASKLNWYYTNQEHARAKADEWKKNNKDKVDQYNKEHIFDRRHSVELRRARLTDADDGTLAPRDWRELILLYGNKCAYCLKKFADLEQDHVEPLSQGGLHSILNVVPACRSCNRTKAASYIEPQHYMWFVINKIHSRGPGTN